jgi:hypothetical protein
MPVLLAQLWLLSSLPLLRTLKILGAPFVEDVQTKTSECALEQVQESFG